MVYSKEERKKEIVRTSTIGIIVSTTLSVFKIIVGLLSNSMVIILDGVENISNALGAVVTIIGIKLSGKAPDKKHPLGYGRIEFITDLLVASFVLYVGLTAFIAGVQNIFQPKSTEYSYTIYGILLLSAVVKFFLARHEKETGLRLKSRALIGAAVDSLANALVSISIIFSAILFEVFGVHLESYIGLAISILIIRGGIIMMRDAIEEVLGKRAKDEHVDQIKSSVLTFDEVLGVHDVVLHSYGRDRYVGSLHIEIPCTISTLELDQLERKIVKRVKETCGVAIAGISVYTVNTEDPEVHAMYREIKSTVLQQKSVLDIHGVMILKEEKKIYFDVILDISVDNHEELIDEIHQKIAQIYGGYEIFIQNDLDI